MAFTLMHYRRGERKWPPVSEEDEAVAVFVSLSKLTESSVGSRFCAVRKLAGMSQAKLADEATNFLPEKYKEKYRITQSDISRMERNPGSAKFSTMAAVAKALRCHLVDFTEEMPELLRSQQGVSQEEIDSQVGE